MARLKRVEFEELVVSFAVNKQAGETKSVSKSGVKSARGKASSSSRSRYGTLTR